jgi:hypothetical protein
MTHRYGILSIDRITCQNTGTIKMEAQQFPSNAILTSDDNNIG